MPSEVTKFFRFNDGTTQVKILMAFQDTTLLMQANLGEYVTELIV